MGALTKRRYRPLEPVMLDNAAGAEFMSITGDPISVTDYSACVIEMDFKMADWTPSTDRGLIQYGDIDGNLAFAVDLMNTSGNIRTSYFPAGTIASRVSQQFAPPVEPTGFKRYGIRCSFLANFLGLVSVYSVDWKFGLKWYYSATPSAGLVQPAFNSTGPLLIGTGTGIENIYSFKMWFGSFGVGQIANKRPNIDCGIAQRNPGDTSWICPTGQTVILGGADVERSDAQYYYEAA